MHDDPPVPSAFAVPTATAARDTTNADDERVGGRRQESSDTDAEGNATECTDGKDNDGDGLVDWQHDLGCYGPDDRSEGGKKTGELDNGWTVFEPSKDTRIIYVSSSTGNDANPGTTAAKPKRTLRAAIRAARKQQPDWVLLRRGDTWMESLQVKEGRSPTEPFLVASYGQSTKRPLLKTGAGRGIDHKVKPFDYIAIVGIAFYAHTRDPGSPDYVDGSGENGIGFFAAGDESGRGLLIEDCWFSFYEGNTIQGPGVIEDVVLRRNIFTNNYSETGHAQGLYSKDASLLLEENVFDHNGWYRQQAKDDKKQSKDGGQATIFNHNTYVSNHHGTTFRRNIFMRPSSIGTKWTANGGPAKTTDIVIEDNLYIDAEVGMSIGGNDKKSPHRFKNITVHNNVLLDMGRSRPTNRGLGLCIDINDWDGGRVTNNLCLHQRNKNVKNVRAIEVKGVTRNVLIANNIVHGLHGKKALLHLRDGTTQENVVFRGNLVQAQLFADKLVRVREGAENYGFSSNVYFSVRAEDEWFLIGEEQGDLSFWKRETNATDMAEKVSFRDPSRSIESYQRSLGAEPTIESFIATVLSQSKYRWRQEYTAGEVNAWIRAGFEH